MLRLTRRVTSLNQSLRSWAALAVADAILHKLVAKTHRSSMRRWRTFPRSSSDIGGPSPLLVGVVRARPAAAVQSLPWVDIAASLRTLREAPLRESDLAATISKLDLL